MSSFHGKAIIGSIFLGILVAVLIPDMLFGLLLSIGHGLLELAHLLFEFVEESLDIVIEGLFGTGIHNTQIIVFYILFAGFAYVCYRLSLKVPARYQQIKSSLQTSYSDLKLESVSYWQNLPSIDKIKWIAVGISSFLILIFFGF